MKYDAARFLQRIKSIRNWKLETLPVGRQVRNSRMKFESGFTLIELLIVIGIIGLLTSISIAAYSTYTRNQKYTNTVNDIFNTLQVAKSRASSQYAPGSVCIPKASIPNDPESGWPGLTDYRVVISETEVVLQVTCYVNASSTIESRALSTIKISGIDVPPASRMTLIFGAGDGTVSRVSGTMPAEIEIGDQKKIVVDGNGKITIENN